MIYFVTGIDTDVGKSYATGMFAGMLMKSGRSVITQKLAQTGCAGIPEDIKIHRGLMGIPLQDVDHKGITCPYTFSLPASPHLAAERQKIRIELSLIDEMTSVLASEYDDVVIEGAGGLFVPLNRDTMIIDYLAERDYQTVLVTSPRIGSINHTLMSLEMLSLRGIGSVQLVYNLNGCEGGPVSEDSRGLFAERMKELGYEGTITDMPSLTL